MEEKNKTFTMLDLINQPGICVQNNLITHINSAAEGLLLTPGLDIRNLLLTGQEEYAAFTGGCLYLTLNLSARGRGASVTRMEDTDVFLLEPETDQPELRSMALAARELRDPLAKVMLCMDSLLPVLESDPSTAEQTGRLNRGLYQVLRILGNMSDAARCSSLSRKEAVDLDPLFREIFEKASALIRHTGITLTYEGLCEPLISMADPEQLERAVLNILSNSVKFTPTGSRIDAKLTRRGRMLRLEIRDSGSGIAQNLLSSIFSRYLRQPAIEDSRFGLGLGMVIIRAAAANHGGTVLIDQPDGCGTRITLTLAISQNPDTVLRSPVMRVDYTGERDHMLVELADILPSSAYEKET